MHCLVISIIAVWSCLLLPASAFAGEEVIAVRSLRIPPYEEALRGFTSVVGDLDHDVVLSETSSDVVFELRKMKPKLILALGLEALSKVRDLRDIPVVYLLVPNPRRVATGPENITGVSMDVTPETQLAWMKKILPGLRRIGIIYDPRKTDYILSRARQAAEGMGMELMVEELSDSKEISSRLKKLQGKIDLFWMIPDTTAYSSEATELLLLFSLDSKTPVFTFSRKYVELGALASLDIDLFAAGRQAGEMARQILSGKAASQIPGCDPLGLVPTLNVKVAAKLGIPLGESIVNSSTVVNKE